MLFTKELISGKDIDLTKYNLGIIKQPTVDMFMGNLEITEFMKPFYFERVLKVNKVLVEELPFTISSIISSIEYALPLISINQAVSTPPLVNCCPVPIKY